MRSDAPPDSVKLAVARAIKDTFDRGKWIELGLLTGTADVIQDHPRLLRSLAWGDPDYDGLVHTFVPLLLGEEREDTFPPRPRSGGQRFPNLAVVEEFVDLCLSDPVVLVIVKYRDEDIEMRKEVFHQARGPQRDREITARSPLSERLIDSVPLRLDRVAQRLE